VRVEKSRCRERLSQGEKVAEWRGLAEFSGVSLIREECRTMAVTLRNYQGPEDIDLQNSFWTGATRELPWSWKPTISPSLYSKGAQFDPRSRCFAFERERLVGYMSFTGQGEFVSLGYPWVLPGYEGELQERLYGAVYGFAASSEYGGKTFAQRFRRPWSAQISFFKRHGFTEQKCSPIYALDIGSAVIPEAPISYEIEIHPGFCWGEFRELASRHSSQKELKMSELYFASVGFDFAVTARSKSKLLAYLGFTIRPDTGFAELIAVALDHTVPNVLAPCLESAVEELRSRNALFLGTGPALLEGAFEILVRMGFDKVSEELLLSKNISDGIETDKASQASVVPKIVSKLGN